MKGNSGVLEKWLTPGSQEHGSYQKILDHHLVPELREERRTTSGISPRQMDSGFYYHILRHHLGTKISTVRNDKSLSVHASTPIINRQGKKCGEEGRDLVSSSLWHVSVDGLLVLESHCVAVIMQRFL